jgi:hypothetical protein
MKKSSLRAQKVKRTFCSGVSMLRVGKMRLKARPRLGPRPLCLSACMYRGGSATYVVRVIHLQHPTPTLIHLLMALPTPAHTQRSIHVHIMARQIQANQALENDTPSREGARKEDKQASRRAAIRHHIEDSAEFGRLLEVTGSEAVERVE